jgi:hypothetical protein
MRFAVGVALILALLAVAFAATVIAVTYRQHNPPCPNAGERGSVPTSCLSNWPTG